MKFEQFPMRQVHLDFHTSPDIPDVGADWDAAHFIETLTRARVNSITVFAKCHHGMNYYPSKIGPVHPSLKFDLLGEQIEACHRAGIRCPIYLSVVWDVSAAERRPEWRQISLGGEQVGGLRPHQSGPLAHTAWPYLCVNNGYTDELLAQTEELMGLYDCDGFFYDIVMYHADGCVCRNCLRALKSSGMDPENSLHRRANNHASARRFLDRTATLIREKLPEAGIFFNSRWGMHFADEKQFYSQVEIESLPTGGWGYGFYPLWSRYGRNFGLPMLGMTGRFHRTWADWGGLKHPDALRFECGGIVATGGAVSIGDQLHPRGRLNRAVYDVIGEAFRDVEAVEPYCVGAEAETQIGLLVLNPDADKANLDAAAGNVEGAARMLLELHHQFDVIRDTTCPDFSRYDLLVLADRAVATRETARRLRAFVAGGGRLLLSHEALLESGNFVLASEMGVDCMARAQSVPDYFAITDASGLQNTILRSGFAYSLYEGPAICVSPRPGTEILADAYETYFNRTGVHFSSHGYTPPVGEKADYPAVTRRGGVVYIYGPIFSAYQRYGSLAFRALVGGCLDLLLPEKRVETDAPPATEVSLMRQKKTEGGVARHIVHLVNYSPQRRAPGHVEALEAPVPLRDVALRLRRSEAVQRVYLARSGGDLPFTVQEGVVSVTVPRVDAHEAVVFE